MMTSEKGSKRDKNQNIQVFVRLRPLNQRERDIKSLGVVEVLNGREVIVRSQQSIHTKKFTFDRAFGPHVKQVEVYQQVVSPLIEEVLCGYNCTVFAYGQTGTGKTHTMVGESSGDETNWQSDPLSGIIPRALSQLFDELRISNTEYTVRVSYLELYNEELFDLLSSSEDNSKLRIYEDVTRKGANIVNGLEEITVYNKNEVYKIMSQGQERKKVASTLMNAQSSRSHTVFTIVVHMKENSPEGEELVKIGKLNLVDLAGSENISKAGSDNPAKRERARECVNINQSLLTLGRVITALVERHPHIPYRESKLTRILQESLGGRTKTSIIATISPGHKDLEETTSTLEYAHRAKNIQNKPEVNQKMTKKAMLKEFAEEIDKLKRDLQAARDKNGVYLADETFAEMTLKDEEQRKEIQELLLKKRALEEERDRMENVFSELNQTLQEKDSELNSTRNVVKITKKQLANTKNILQTTKLHYEEQKHLVRVHCATEEELSAQAKDIMAVAETAASHAHCLHDSVDKRRSVESANLQTTQRYRQQAAQQRAHTAAALQRLVASLTGDLTALHHHTQNHTTNSTQCLEESSKKLEELTQKIIEAMNEAKSSTSEACSSLAALVQQQRGSLERAARAQAAGTRAALTGCARLAAQGTSHAAHWGARAALGTLVTQWSSDGLERIASLRRAHGVCHSAASEAESERAAVCRNQRDARKRRQATLSGKIDAAIAQLEAERVQAESRLSKQLADIEEERAESEARLGRWADEERRLLEERLERHLAAERGATEQRLAARVAQLHEERKLLDERVRCIEAWRHEKTAAVEEENKIAESELIESEHGREDCLNNMDKFGKELVESTTAMEADLEAFSTNVVQVVEHYSEELLRVLSQAAGQIEQEANSAISSEEQAGAELVACVEGALAAVLHSSTQALDAVMDNIQATGNCTTSSLSELNSSTRSLAAGCRSRAEWHGAAALALLRRVDELAGAVRAALLRHEQLEGARLGRELRVYEPTGNTPQRQEYRFPRALPATSPHERILARFRAARQHTDDEVCVVTESDTESRPASEADSSGSEDSALALTSPSPPAEPRSNPISKSTSETDIYYRMPPGKENPQYRAVSHKKTSRLPAPTSLKKPLLERN